MGPDPAVAAVRLAVRRISLPETVVVACSGGADSLALLAATLFEVRRAPVQVVGAVIDHGLQPGSAEHTAGVVQQMARLGAVRTVSRRVVVDTSAGGMEAGARSARYAALTDLAHEVGAGAVLVAHTVDDQAESVLLGLTQGSGPRSLAGMRDAVEHDSPAGGRMLFLRPLLRTVTRTQTEAACRAEGIDWWDDPHNEDPRFTRARIRHVVMPLLEKELGPGVTGALARTAHLVTDDLDALDTTARVHLRRLAVDAGLDVGRTEQLGRAVRTRVLRLAALEAGVPPRELTHGHIESLDAMLQCGPGAQRELHLPGHVSAVLGSGMIRFVSTHRPDGPAVSG